jgi:hypothetical protein
MAAAYGRGGGRSTSALEKRAYARRRGASARLLRRVDPVRSPADSTESADFPIGNAADPTETADDPVCIPFFAYRFEIRVPKLKVEAGRAAASALPKFPSPPPGPLKDPKLGQASCTGAEPARPRLTRGISGAYFLAAEPLQNDSDLSQRLGGVSEATSACGKLAQRVPEGSPCSI